MIENFNSWFWGSFFGPLNKRRFGLRIWLRVRWLTFKLWFKHIRWRRLGGFFVRPAFLLLIAAGMPFLFLWYRAQLFPGVEFPSRLSLGTQADWRAIAQPALILIGVPAAFVLWMFRDANAQADLENRRKDVNLKEFQEIQLRAAGAMDEKLPESARESLQIAATHQLAGFLRGEYGASFQRPAWELLRARLLASSQAMGYQSIPSQIEAWREADPADRVSASELRTNIHRAVRGVTANSIGKAQRDAVRDEWHTIFGGKLPLPDTVFDGIDLPSHALLSARNLERCSFIGAALQEAHLEGTDLRGAHLQAANLFGAHLETAHLAGAHLEGAMLVMAHLENAGLSGAHLEGGYLVGAHLEGAVLQTAHLEDAKLDVANLEGANLLEAHLEGAKLGFAKLGGAKLQEAHLEGANLSGAHFDGTDLTGAHLENAFGVTAQFRGANLADAKFNEKTVMTDAAFDNATQFARNWDTLSDEDKDAARAPWIARGMKHVDQLALERKQRRAKAKPTA